MVSNKTIFFLSKTEDINMTYITWLINTQDILNWYNNILQESFRAENQLHVQ